MLSEKFILFYFILFTIRVISISISSFSMDKSVLFAEQLTVREDSSSRGDGNSSNGHDIRELSKKIDKYRQNKVSKPLPLRVSSINTTNTLERLSLLNDKKMKKQRQDGNNMVDNKFKKIPQSTNKPDNITILTDDKLSIQYEKIIENARNLTTYGILKNNGKTIYEDQLIGKIDKIQIISDSLKIIIVNDDLMDKYWKIGIVCLWNEWIEINKGDTILLPDIDLNSNNEELQWSFKWKKIVSL